MAATKKSTSMGIAYDKILQKIISGQLPPGTPLREERLAEEFGLSPTPVREAFRRLEYEGWLQSRPYQGCCTRKFSEQEVDELYKLREVLEGLAAATAAREATKEDLEKIKATLIAEENYLKETAEKYSLDDIPPTFFEDVDFHAAIADAGNNQLLKQRLSMLKAQISFTFIMLRKKTTNLAEQYRVFEEHTMIYNAIVRKWDDVAEVLMKRHISDARSKYLGLVNSLEEE